MQGTLRAILEKLNKLEGNLLSRTIWETYAKLLGLT